VVLGIQLALVVGLGLLFSCLNVYYRDVGYIVEVGVTFWFYATPVFYPTHIVETQAMTHPWLYHAYFLNPMAGLLAAYRDAVLYNAVPSLEGLVWPVAVAVGCLGMGAVVFRRGAPCIADYL
jgi:ABC-type polysaccharide/polyol phosphate export permease